MIRTLKIQNFKSIKNLELGCKRINIFIGKPNVGKSNILEAIGILSFGGYGGSLSDFVRFENIGNLFYDNDVNEPVEISAESNKFKMQFDGSVFVGRYGDSNEVGFEYNGRRIGGTIPVKDLRPFKFYRFKKLREFRSHNLEFLLPPHGRNLLTVLLTHKELKSTIAEIFKSYGLRIALKPQENKIEVVKLFEDILIGYPYSLVSDTLQRVVFYLAAIESNKDSILAFEEPEAHAFPYYTKFLAERIALDNSNQYFISTHNPYFLLSVLEKTPLEDINVFVVYFEDYQTKVKRLSKGNLEEIMDLELDVFFNIDRFLGEQE
ncbi:AAA family ATPase [Thermococcus aggregans]|uniref:AAA family ATPase n=1 Tax=Thermococcus aggregans TaxID=110163 RepID=A0A9E7SPQ6_THEAG|nr:AAA family ATPase [Thermococcus aggregans]USS41784.1 AAA family ATPase [Thermococcus aggregans]